MAALCKAGWPPWKSAVAYNLVAENVISQLSKGGLSKWLKISIVILTMALSAYGGILCAEKYNGVFWLMQYRENEESSYNRENAMLNAEINLNAAEKVA